MGGGGPGAQQSGAAGVGFGGVKAGKSRTGLRSLSPSCSVSMPVSARRRMASWGVYPGSPTSWLVVVMTTVGSSCYNVDVSMGLVYYIQRWLPEGRSKAMREGRVGSVAGLLGLQDTGLEATGQPSWRWQRPRSLLLGVRDDEATQRSDVSVSREFLRLWCLPRMALCISGL